MWKNKKRIEELEKRVTELEGIIKKIDSPFNSFYFGKIENWQKLAKMFDDVFNELKKSQQS